ncbi:MAG: DegT/DnrJ/EryC1/StrS aminotransferase family protein [Planctomycetes bacterium]|nr:DegT/DnrJ/EryC1/StrS aminotransferase family protein [Planctomycetota bacterium]
MILFDRKAPLAPGQCFARGVLGEFAGQGAFAYGRAALLRGLGAIERLKTGRILLPGFLCRTVADTLRESGASPVFYPVDEGLEPDWKALARLHTPDMAGLMMVHYFGQPQRVEAFRDFCRSRELLLIEDNAHGYGGRVEEGEMGKLGDLSISSPRKTLPIANGALLWMKEGTILRPEAGGESLFPARRLVEGALRRAIATSPLYRRMRLGSCRYHLQEFRAEAPVGDWGMTASAGAYLAALNLAEQRKQRRTVYAIWQAWCGEQGLTPVYETLHEGALPFVFPAYAKGPEKSRELFKWGYLNGIDVHSWPDLDSEAAASDPALLDRWHRLVLFPIHHLMDEGELRRRLERRPFSPSRQA